METRISEIIHMSAHGRCFRQSFSDRQRWSHSADRQVAAAILLASRAADQQSKVLWCFAAKRFETAAKLYKQAGLGLLSKLQYGSAARCFAAFGSSSGAARCQREEEGIAAYWQGIADA